MTRAITKARRKYKAFHGFNGRRVPDTFFHVPKTLVCLGQAHAIEYICEKYNGGGDGTIATYRHIFDTPCHLFMDERGKKQLYILGTKLKVTDAGIEN